MLTLDPHDEALVAAVKHSISNAIEAAHAPVVVIKRISVFAMRHRNKGRQTAMKRHPFTGICEASGAPLDRQHAHLDELQPELVTSATCVGFVHVPTTAAPSPAVDANDAYSEELMTGCFDAQASRHLISVVSLSHVDPHLENPALLRSHL